MRLTFLFPAGWTQNLFAAFLSCWMLVACGNADDTKKRSLETAVVQVARILDDASRAPMAAAALQSTLEGGGTLLHYVVASLPEKFTHEVVMDKPARAWCVVVKAGKTANDAVVEGYGADLSQPVFTRTARIGPPPKRR